MKPGDGVSTIATAGSARSRTGDTLRWRSSSNRQSASRHHAECRQPAPEFRRAGGASHRTARQRDLCDMPECQVRVELSDIEREFKATGRSALCKAAAASSSRPRSPSASRCPRRRCSARRKKRCSATCSSCSARRCPCSRPPAFPVRAKRKGAALVIINRDPTEMDELADLVIHASIGETMGRVVDEAS